MNKLLVLSALTILFLIGCKSFKKVSSPADDKVGVIEIAISDFSQNRKLLKKDSRFEISKREAVNNKNIIIVDISTGDKMLLTAETKAGSKGKMASRYIEKNGKLFYWWDDDYSLTDEALAIFSKYNLLQDDMGGELKLPDNSIDEEEKFVFYYFCKNDFRKYKKVVTNKGWFYNNAPEINCNCDSAQSK